MATKSGGISTRRHAFLVATTIALIFALAAIGMIVAVIFFKLNKLPWIVAAAIVVLGALVFGAMARASWQGWRIDERQRLQMEERAKRPLQPHEF